LPNQKDEIQLYAIIGMNKTLPVIALGPYHDLVQCVYEAMSLTNNKRDKYDYRPVPLMFRGVLMTEPPGSEEDGSDSPELRRGYL
jgi:hypothetical protein